MKQQEDITKKPKPDRMTALINYLKEAKEKQHCIILADLMEQFMLSKEIVDKCINQVYF